MFAVIGSILSMMDASCGTVFAYFSNIAPVDYLRVGASLKL
jgi:hypothetical protein